jgi:alkanesulfonate monooxygenase SsuD/methylene tetrahydromethanopterin reductase-like flavin-dependent oxidoreductase (luciferase family)
VDVKVGLIVPQGYFNEFDGWEPAKAWARILEVATLAERLGFESVWFGEHVVAKWDPRTIAFDCVALASAVAAAVPRVGIGFVVLNSTFRNPALTAKTAGTIDVISGGRLTLGLGAGFREVEAISYGFDYPPLAARLAVLAEHLEIISRLVAPGHEPVTFEGQHARVHEVTNNPAGVQRPRIPIMIGGHGPNITFRLVARFADELNLDLLPVDVPAALEVLWNRFHEVGRDPATLRLAAGINPSMPYHGLRSTGGQRLLEPGEFAFMAPEKFATITTRVEELVQWRELGFSRLTAGVPGLANTDETLYEFLDDLRAAGIELS